MDWTELDEDWSGEREEPKAMPSLRLDLATAVPYPTLSRLTH